MRNGDVTHYITLHFFVPGILLSLTRSGTRLIITYGIVKELKEIKKQLSVVHKRDIIIEISILYNLYILREFSGQRKTKGGVSFSLMNGES